MVPRGAQHERQLLPEGAGAEEEDHDERVGEADFGAVDGAVAGRLEQGEDIVVGRVADDLLEGGLRVRPVSCCCWILKGSGKEVRVP